MEKTDVFILLGGNLGNVESTFQSAKNAIKNSIGVITKESSMYQSPAWGFESTNPFLNQVIQVTTQLPAKEVLKKLLGIETHLGRFRDVNAIGYTNRPIDLDILYYGNAQINTAILTIPHPAIAERKFTLLPLQEIAPNLIHPFLQITQTELLKQCKDFSSVTKL